VRAEFYRPEQPEQVLGRARWTGARVEVEAEDGEVRRALDRVFRPTPVIVDDPSLRPTGAGGPVLLPPRSLAWFRAAAEARAGEVGMRARLVPEGRDELGWEPAGAYRTFNEQVERKERTGLAAGPG
jgi:hypothetical protein